MTAIGVADVAGGRFGGFPVSANGSRTPGAEHNSAHTQSAVVIVAATALIDVRSPV